VFGIDAVCDITAGVDITRAVKLQKAVTFQPVIDEAAEACEVDEHPVAADSRY
jgi:hypothetical protein